MFSRFTQAFTKSNWNKVGSFAKVNKTKFFVGGAVMTAGSAFLCTQAFASEAKPALSPAEWREFKLEKVEPLTHNTKLYRFTLPEDQQLTLPVASFVLVQAQIEGEEKPVQRPYTPVSYDTTGYFDLVVKSYPNGKLSKHIGQLKEGDSLKFKGPMKKIQYEPNMKKHIGMIAGGSGITPMLQIVHHILNNQDDKTEVSLIFANQSEEDIILKNRLEEYAKHKNFKVYYTIDKPSHPDTWKQGVGFVSENMVKSHLPAPSDDTLILVCGPPPMMKSVSGTLTEKWEQGPVEGVLKNCGYTEKMVYKF
eukprot:TRINITY_DN3152_c0_g1_i1.p1 TRINITY_DN3152_c0_g1~~TRINITY_DN3152_c0_g1_i1.p1  ORF type:complete len:307 (-),score=70.72 TRINITY_DN3152_c0_g1_i1:78-998(-)